MTETMIPINSLVLYKKRPARVVKGGERPEIELDDRNQLKVRPKDVILLHPGPAPDPAKLAGKPPPEGDILLAWQLLAEGETACTLAELAEMAFGDFTPETAWAAWQWLEDGLYFDGLPEALRARPEESVRRDQQARQARQAEAEARADFLQRAARGEVRPESDQRYLQELIDLGLGRRKESRLLRELGHSERAENAHAMLLDWGIWDLYTNPHPARLGMAQSEPLFSLPALEDEDRLDLTGLETYAIDDKGNQDPDDAVSLVECRVDDQGRFTGGKLWVHVADAAALILRDSPADQEARRRGATLYLPEGAVKMLPGAAVERLGLGLNEQSPALSFAISLNAEGYIEEVDVQLTLARVQRQTYEGVEALMEQEPFHSMETITRAYQTRREAAGAFVLDLPEVNMRVTDGEVIIEPMLRLRSRNMVREAMLMAGEAAGLYALQHGLAVPYVIQEGQLQPAAGAQRPAKPPVDESVTLAKRFALRRSLRRSQVSSHPGLHMGVGLSTYSRTTSPLRRYLDLVTHQQLRSKLEGTEPLSQQELLERLGGMDEAVGAISLAENLSRRHWTLVYLMQRPEWRGEGVVVEASGKRALVLVPELALEAPIHLPAELPLDTVVNLTVRSIRLPELEVHFNVL